MSQSDIPLDRLLPKTDAPKICKVVPTAPTGQSTPDSSPSTFPPVCIEEQDSDLSNMAERSTGKTDGVEVDIEIKSACASDMPVEQPSERSTTPVTTHDSPSTKNHDTPNDTNPASNVSTSNDGTQVKKKKTVMQILGMMEDIMDRSDSRIVDYESEIKEDLIIFGEEYVAELDRHKRAVDRLLEDRTAYLIAHDRHQSQNHNQLDVLLSAIDKLEDELDFKRSSTSENSKI
ncbi:hypothetical protein PSTG_08428 [Puccinia striiformis f. sp. tritici PST-78]|uniref:Uncharacterized protein n=1 Tax=Puccinia striiformis f. sp. tritici PST-78 TaxID=1165861 RepID=A0A0L0VGD2_9BASI|nr:hypothetical protein PSTG_08428 [Puccinia striiformis f. sp. tritici PST-78]